MIFNFGNRRKSFYEDKPLYRYHRRNNNHQQQHCLRNPIVVFCLSFLALGSLRFRAPKQAAHNLIQRGRQRIRAARMGNNINNGNSNNNNLREEEQDSEGTATGAMTGGAAAAVAMERTMAYELMEGGGNRHKSRRVQRYRAVWVKTSASSPPNHDNKDAKGATSIASFPLASRRLGRPRFNRHLTTTTTTALLSKTPVSVYEWTQIMLQDPKMLDEFVQILKTANDYKAFFFETKGVSAASARNVAFEFVLVDAPKLDSFVQAESVVDNTNYHSDNHSKKNKGAAMTTPFDDQFQSLLCQQQQKDREREDEKGSTGSTTTAHTSRSNACVFLNLGGDAILVAPQPYVPPKTTNDKQQQHQNSQQHPSKQHQHPQMMMKPAQQQSSTLLDRTALSSLSSSLSSLTAAAAALSSSSTAQTYGHLANFVRYAPKDQVHQYWNLVLKTYLERLSSSSSLTDNDMTESQKNNNNNTTALADSTTGSSSSSSSSKSSQAIPKTSTTNNTPILSQLKSLLEQQQQQQQQQQQDKKKGGPAANNSRNLPPPTALQHDPEAPVWLSTSGMGVPWLHMRLDSSPKYYTYQGFSKPALSR